VSRDHIRALTHQAFVTLRGAQTISGQKTMGSALLMGGNNITGIGAVVATDCTSNTIRRDTATYSNALLKAAAATPLALYGAGGGSNVNVIDAIMLRLNPGSEVLTESGDNLQLYLNGTGGTAIGPVIEMTGFIDQAVETYLYVPLALQDIVVGTDAENSTLDLSNEGSEFGGNASNDATLSIAIWRRITAIP